MPARKLPVAAITAAAIFAVPATASAHVSAAQVACDQATYQFRAFHSGANLVHYRIEVDGAAFVTGDYTLDGDRGKTGALNVPLGLHDSHTVSAFAWWGPDGVADRNAGGSQTKPLASQSLTCAATPPQPPAAPLPPPAPVPSIPVVEAPPAPVAVPAIQIGTAISIKKPRKVVHRCERKYSKHKHRMVFVCPRKPGTAIKPKFTG